MKVYLLTANTGKKRFVSESAIKCIEVIDSNHVRLVTQIFHDFETYIMTFDELDTILHNSIELTYCAVRSMTEQLSIVDSCEDNKDKDDFNENNEISF